MTMAGNTQLTSAGQKSERRYHLGLIFSVLLVAIFVYGGWQLMNPATLPIKHVSIEGEFRHLVPAMLEGTVSKVVRGGFFNVNVDTIQETLLQEPWVKHVAVRRIWPDAIAVHVQEQIAFARWGDDGLLNGEAEFFAPAKETFPVSLPLLRGPENSESLLLEYFERLSTMLGNSALKVSEITLNERRAWLVVLDNGLIIKLGKQSINERLEKFSRYVLFQLAESLNQIAMVDMRYTNGFALSLKSDFPIVKSGQK